MEGLLLSAGRSVMFKWREECKKKDYFILFYPATLESLSVQLFNKACFYFLFFLFIVFKAF